MSSGGLFQLLSNSYQDAYLMPDFSRPVTALIPPSGDLISNTYIQVVLPRPGESYLPTNQGPLRGIQSYEIHYCLELDKDLTNLKCQILKELTQKVRKIKPIAENVPKSFRWVDDIGHQLIQQMTTENMSSQIS